MKRNEIAVGILGATGVVGTEMCKVLEERNVPCTSLRLLADRSEAGKKVIFRGKELTVEEATDDSFDGLDILLVAVSDTVSRRFSPVAVAKGVVVIDNSSAYRMDPEVPLIVPEVNPQDIFWHKGIIANPNCSTIIALVAVHALHKAHPIKRMIVSTYQAVSGAGINGLKELEEQAADYANGRPVSENKVFQHQIAFNLIPHIDAFQDNGYTREELKMLNEGRKIFHEPDLDITCTCVRVPVLRSHSESIYLEFNEKVSVEEARKLISAAAGTKLVDEPDKNIYPMPLDTSNQDLVFVGRIRQDMTEENALDLWCCGDQIRKGAATNAVQIAELIIAKERA